MGTTLMVEDFGRRYNGDGPWAVRHLSFALPQGSVTALVGPNGAGKSTLIRGCMGFERADEGTIAIAGFDLRRDRSAALRRVAYVPQASALYRAFSVDDHLDLAGVARPSFDRPLAVRLLAAAEIGLGRRVRELSGGEQAQVSLAVAVATRAPLLLFDEPIASLDPLARRDFLAALFAQASTDGATVVLSSHLVNDIEHMCDRVLVLSQGSIALDSTVAAATTQFRIVAADSANGRQIVGRFAGATGEDVALIRGSDGGSLPTLEDVVLGHLAAARHV